MVARLAMVTARRRNHFAPIRVSGDGEVRGSNRNMFYKKLKVDNESGRRRDAEIAEVSRRGTPRPISFFLSAWPRVLRSLRDETLIHCGAALLVLIIVTPHTWAQK